MSYLSNLKIKKQGFYYVNNHGEVLLDTHGGVLLLVKLQAKSLYLYQK